MRHRLPFRSSIALVVVLWIGSAAAFAQPGALQKKPINLKTNAEIRAPRGRDPIITSDGRFVVFALAPYKNRCRQGAQGEKEAGRDAEERPRVRQPHERAGHDRCRARENSPIFWIENTDEK